MSTSTARMRFKNITLICWKQTILHV